MARVRWVRASVRTHEIRVIAMLRRPHRSRGLRLAAASGVALAATAMGAATTTAQATGTPITGALMPPVSKSAHTTVTISSSAPKVVSSTGHKLRIQMLVFRTSDGTRIELTAETRNRAERHQWSFKVPRRAVSVSAEGSSRIHLTSPRSAGYAAVSVKAGPHGRFTHTTCHGKTATRTRHVSFSGTLFLHTRSRGSRAWGSVGNAHRKLHFSASGTVLWTRPAAGNCSDNTTTLPCRSTLLWFTSGGLGEFELVAGENKGTGSLISGSRTVQLAKPAGATRTDSNTLPDGSQNTFTDNGGSVTVQTAFRAGTATMTSSVSVDTVVQRCASGKKISIDFWPGTFTNGPVPIRVPEQIFGPHSVADGSGAGLYRITLLG
jgi:hypothetical protein